jgi:hypothetical protein
LPLWAAALVCLLALSAVTWAAQSYLAPPSSKENCITDEELLKLQNCPTPNAPKHYIE